MDINESWLGQPQEEPREHSLSELPIRPAHSSYNEYVNDVYAQYGIREAKTQSSEKSDLPRSPDYGGW